MNLISHIDSPKVISNGNVSPKGSTIELSATFILVLDLKISNPCSLATFSDIIEISAPVSKKTSKFYLPIFAVVPIRPLPDPIAIKPCFMF